MRRLYTTRTRPAPTARVARKAWDWVTAQDGAEPRELSFVVDDGGFRDWLYINATGELKQIEGPLIGGALPHRYPWDAPC